MYSRTACKEEYDAAHLEDRHCRGRGALEAMPVPGTEEAAHPFWSPDSDSLGFFAKGPLMKVALKGGAPASVAEALFPFGGTWSPSGRIVFAPEVIMAGLYGVAAAGGAIEPATVLEPSLGDTSHCRPCIIPRATPP